MAFWSIMILYFIKNTVNLLLIFGIYEIAQNQEHDVKVSRRKVWYLHVLYIWVYLFDSKQEVLIFKIFLIPLPVAHINSCVISGRFCAVRYADLFNRFWRTMIMIIYLIPIQVWSIFVLLSLMWHLQMYDLWFFLLFWTQSKYVYKSKTIPVIHAIAVCTCMYIIIR